MVGDGGGVDHTKGGRAGVVVGCEVGGHVGAVGVEVEEGGQDVEEEVHGNIARIEWREIDRMMRKTFQAGLSSYILKSRALFPCRDGSQVSPEGIKQLDRFHRIR